ncbi:MAG: hypothetical protein J3K34DRAFT_424771 [Monoraphidium minutum]|nr:MAG: hypothetical protein J3K34DRAFT_424771 [Monoraphidium minutum]
MRSPAAWAAAPLLALLLAAACAGAGASVFGKTPEDAMIKWLEGKGGKFAVTIETPKSGGARGTYATKAVPKDGLLAKIPLSAGIWFPASYNDFAELGVITAREAAKKGGSFRPYLDALPMLRDPLHTISFETFPLEYLHLIQNDVMATHITSTQSGTHNYWATNGVELAEEGITLDLLRAALVTVATRYFGISHKGSSASIMIPLLDFANHFQNCSNYYEYRPCSLTDEQAHKAASGKATPEEEAKWGADAVEQDEVCCYWRAGEPIKAGQEACNRYGYMAPDQAFFQYGFNLPDEPPALSRMDQASYSSEYIYGTKAHEEPEEFKGSADELEEEAARVTAQLELVRRGAKVEASAPAARGDPGGAVLSGLRALRRQRIEALEAELKRLGAAAAEARGSEEL